jgi:hypothetical protein
VRTSLRTGTIPGLALVLAHVFASPAVAAWSHDPAIGGLPLTTMQNGQTAPVALPDGAGGAFVVWLDYRTGGLGGTSDLYAQRVSAAGTLLWDAGGLPVCTAASFQTNPVLTPDGAGGVIVAWTDWRNGHLDIYAQRIDGEGAVQWATNGVAVYTGAETQSAPTIASDGAGGAIIAWEDFRSTTTYDIYAQRLNDSGVAQWNPGGVVVSNATGDQRGPQLVSDGAGGSFICWVDGRNASLDLYGNRLGPTGALQSPGTGVALCTFTGDQTDPRIVADGTGGAILTWGDLRSGNADIYAARITPIVGAHWNTGGNVVCSATGEQQGPAITSDGAGGAIIAWSDSRGADTDVYAQRMTAAGGPAWTANGVLLSVAGSNQSGPVIAADGAGGALVAWRDFRGPAADIYAQRVGPTGVGYWTSGGTAISTAVRSQLSPSIVSDGAGGAIVAWGDLRNMSIDAIYAQRVHRYGQLGSPEPLITSVKDVTGDQGGWVKVSWDASYLDVDPVYGVLDYRVWRSAPAAAAANGAARMTRGITRDPDEAAGTGMLLADPRGALDYAWELVATQAAALLPAYSVVAPTTRDSIAGSNPRTAFMVEARAGTSLSSDRWYSFPDSGYSVDDLAPLAPAPFTGTYAAGTTTLLWNPNGEADLAGYRLYRGTTAGFAIGPASLLAAVTDVNYVDAAGAPYWYKLTAVDVHGNESPVATLLPGGALDVAVGAPRELAFAAPTPNPARGATTLRFALPRAGAVRLTVYDAQGRCVRTLADGVRGAGEQAATWDLRDDAGRAVGAGLYFARLEHGREVRVRRIAATR